MISCAEAVRRLWDYLEQDLRPQDRVLVDEHLAFCRRCCGEVEFAEALRDMLRSTSPPEMPREVEARLHGFLADIEKEAL